MKDPAVIAQSEHAPTPPSAPGGGASPAKQAFFSGAMLLIGLSFLWFIYRLFSFITLQREDYTFGSFVKSLHSGSDVFFSEGFLFVSAIAFILCFYDGYWDAKRASKKGASQEDKENHTIERYATLSVVAGALLTIVSFLLMAQMAVTFSALHFLFHWVALALVGVLMMILCFVGTISRFKKDFPMKRKQDPA